MSANPTPTRPPGPGVEEGAWSELPLLDKQWKGADSLSAPLPRFNSNRFPRKAAAMETNDQQTELPRNERTEAIWKNLERNENIQRNPDRSVTVKLLVPLVIKQRSKPDETLDELVLRRPTGRTLEAIDLVKGDAARTFAFVEGISGISARHLRDLDGEDMGVIGEVMSAFLGKSS